MPMMRRREKTVNFDRSVSVLVKSSRRLEAMTLSGSRRFLVQPSSLEEGHQSQEKAGEVVSQVPSREVVWFLEFLLWFPRDHFSSFLISFPWQSYSERQMMIWIMIICISDIIIIAGQHFAKA